MKRANPVITMNQAPAPPSFNGSFTNDLTIAGLV
jgi:hypothetical protein